MISKKTIEEVFNIAVIEDVIGDFVALKKAGANFKGLSPFSDEKPPLLSFLLPREFGRILVLVKVEMLYHF